MPSGAEPGIQVYADPVRYSLGRADPPLRLARDDKIKDDFLLDLALRLGGLGLARGP
jgi:hypothetical protein